ncbi:MAG: cardiolipin synthase ClsB [Zoogloeaceae bacterium]|jgi:cardiolipin synthase|nr:cardiolipin synthase ClsB [Zoogloeaceae bacterium]
MTEFTGGNHITLLRCGEAYFPALLEAIAAARREIFLEAYIFADDAIGRAVAAALADAARRGVRARVLVDGFGARHFIATFGDLLRAAGVAVLVFRLEIARFSGAFRLRRHRLRRLHRKLVAIDRRIAFIGGINIIDDYNVPFHIGPRFDYCVRIEGPLLAPIWDTLRRDWEKVAWASFKRRDRLPANDLPDPPVAGFQQAAFLLRNSIRHRNTIANAYLEAMRAARVSIVIANAYFFPGLRFRRALTNAARRGIRVTVLLQGKSDHPLLHHASQALYGLLLRAGVRIFEYQRGFLHAKVAVIDQKWATVGSFNIDPFSLFLARESNVAVLDSPFAVELDASLRQAIANDAKELTLNILERLPWHSRLLRWLCYGLVCLMTALGVRERKAEDKNGSS